MTRKQLADIIYLVTAFVGAIIVASNIGQARLGYSIFFVSSLAALYLLAISNASRSLVAVNILFMGIDIYGIIRG